MFAKSFILSLPLISGALAATAEDWRKRSIYELVTDRFARTDGSTTAACSTSDRVFCGGTWQGLTNHLDYIQNMGFTAVWISPITMQIYGNTHSGEGYHGYWPKDYYSLNPNFGTADDLKTLASALHDRGMYLMVDLVVNHYASWGDEDIQWSQYVPFNDEKYFHDKCWINWGKQDSVENCWMGDGYVPLPDLDTENDFVSSTLETYVSELISNYSIDGLRIDAAKNIRKDFWPGFCSAAGVYCQGEVWSNNADYVCSYQNYMDGLHNYPMHDYTLAAFRSNSGDMSALAETLNAVTRKCADVGLLGSFVENHDNARMGSVTSDMSVLKSFAAMTVLSGNGMPIAYYGQEQILTASGDPDNREALWLTGYPTGGDKLYDYFATLNQLRNWLVWNADEADYLTAKPSYEVASDAHTLIASKGVMKLLASNVGSGSDPKVATSGWSAGADLVDALTCTTLTADSRGRATATMPDSAPVAILPTSYLAGSGICGL
ncbi:glycoside hydrolase family 13 protein [Schizophyllum amplum]|uniref:Alpha-amylase n=1 Tax=Schizophyllum amplum TaxID=97359 RepID=A0A550CPY7_9AGAR|nr:glycoside hydrolase family 13 protein [Auriculariopsis ampla]